MPLAPLIVLRMGLSRLHVHPFKGALHHIQWQYQLFPPQQAGVAPCDTGFLSGQGRGKKLVTEEPKPVGSGTTIYSYSSIENIYCVLRRLLLRRLSGGRVLKASLQ